MMTLRKAQSQTTAYNKATTYYMSGTGNTFRVATWFDETAKARGIESTIAPIESAKPEEEVEASDRQLLALFLPTHGFTAPWQMIKFAFCLPRKKGVDAFCVATRAGTKFGPLFLPGLSGTAVFIIALILAIRGFNLRGVLPINMTSNWISAHPGYSPKSARAIHSRSRPKAASFFECILSGKTSWINLNNALELLFGLAILPISIGYLLVGRFFLAKLFFSNNKCVSCGLCARNCPTESIIMMGKSKPRPYWKYNCESCMRCMAYCPNQAVEAGHSWAVLLWLIISLPVGIYLLQTLTEALPGLEILKQPLTLNLLNLLYLYPSLIISYASFFS